MTASSDFESKEPLLRLFNSLMNGNTELYFRFIHKSKSKLHIPVSSHVYLTQKIKFLYHIIMIMGCVSTELDIFSSSNLIDAFLASKLFNDENNRREQYSSYVILLPRWCCSWIV